MLLVWIICIIILLIVIITCIISFHYNENLSIKISKLNAYCISLYDAFDRKKAMEDAYRYFPFYLQFVDAVDTRRDLWNLYTAFLEDAAIDRMNTTIIRKVRQSHFDLTPGAVGCFLSHVKVWIMYMQTQSKEPCLIFEDDASKPAQTFIHDLEYILGKWPPHYDIIFLNHQIFGSTRFIDKNKRFMILTPDSHFFFTNCYLITRLGVNKILNILQKSDYKFSVQIDAYLNHLINTNQIKACFWHECS